MPRLAPSNDRSSKKLIISNTHSIPWLQFPSSPLSIRNILSRKLARKG